MTAQLKTKTERKAERFGELKMRTRKKKTKAIHRSNKKSDEEAREESEVKEMGTMVLGLARRC